MARGVVWASRLNSFVYSNTLRWRAGISAERGLSLVGGEPERVERLQASAGAPSGPVARADDVIDEVALVLGQVQLRRRRAACSRA